jgi:nucleotide-binding universal stress UspA family protein
MLQTVLVPLDGSELSERALPMATALADATGAHVVLTRVALAQGLPGEMFYADRTQAIDEAEAYLAAVAQRMSADGLQAATVVHFGDADEGILEAIVSHQADLVVMSTHGRSGLGRWVYGSVAEAILARSPVPVLLIRANGDIPPSVLDHDRPIIMAPLDGSRFAEAALPYATALARAFKASLMLIHVYEPPQVLDSDIVMRPDWVAEMLTRDHAAADRYLADVAQRLRGEGIEVQTVMRQGDVAQVILEESWADGTSMIVMATHGRTGLREVLYGNVALDILHRGKLPLLLVRPTGLRSREATWTSAMADSSTPESAVVQS